MEASRQTVKVFGRQYALRTDVEPDHLQYVAQYVDRIMRDVAASTPDTQDAAILAALNIASELMRKRDPDESFKQRIQALIDLIDSV